MHNDLKKVGMRMASPSFFRHPRQFSLAYGVLLISLCVTFAAWFYAKRDTEARDRAHFEEIVQSARNGMDRRIESYVEILGDLGALFAYSGHVTLSDFGAFWTHYDISQKLPGIYLIGYSPLVPLEQKQQYEAGLKQLGFAEAAIKPGGSRPDYFPATYLYPFDVESNDLNERNAIGMDWYTDAARRVAMERARDTGQAVASQPIRFLNDTSGRWATFVYYPLYKNGLFLKNEEDRRASLSGFVFIAFYTKDLFSDIKGSGKGATIDYQVFDKGQSDGLDILSSGHETESAGAIDARFQKTMSLAGAQREWRVRFYTLPGFDRMSGMNFSLYVLGAGVGISLMLFGIVVLISRTMAAKRMAEEAIQVSEIVKESELRVRAVVDNVADGIATIGADGTILTFNPAASKMFGHADEDVAGRNIGLLIPSLQIESALGLEPYLSHDDSGRAGSSVVEVEAQRKCGSVFPMELAVSEMRLKGQRIFVCILRDISERKENEQRLAYLAQYDSLTGLPNRHLFRDRLSQAMSRAIRNNDIVALMFLDLDRFKEINDHLGHHTGDLILKMAAQRIKECLRSSDTVARLGGDEFTVILESLADTEQATMVARKILAEFSRPFVFDGMQFLLTVSIGITFFPEDTQSIDEILKRADMAMYEAKNAGRNDYLLFSPQMNVAATERIHLKNHLQHALDRHELLLHYQPQVDLASGAVIGAEALLRWKHPELGMVPPGKFISLAEETGLIVSLGEWVLRTAARQCAAWQRQGLPPIKVAVNVSARQLRQENFAEQVAAILRETGVKPDLIELEITEGLLIENIRYGRAVMAKLRQMGVQISLDDFGTGYSSLSYLNNLPLDMLKMDGSFVRHLASETPEAENSRAIAKTIITLAHSLRLKVIAEGVETNDQLAYLRDAGCDQIQGYLFSRPVDADRIVELLQQKAIA